MCGPDFSIGLTVLSTYQSMQAARANADYQANVAEQNAKIAERQAIAAGVAGADEQRRIREHGRDVSAAQKVAFSANGLDIGAGSPLQVLADTAYLSEMDAQTSRYNTAWKMWGLNEQARSYRDQAAAARAEGSNAAKASLLTGISSIAKQYRTFGNNIPSSSVDKSGFGGYTYNGPLAPTDGSGNYFIGSNDKTFKDPRAPKYKKWF